MNADAHLMMEAYKTIREQSPLLNNPMGAAVQGAVRGATPYAAGAIAGAKQLGQNMVGAVAGSAQAPQSPVAAAKQAFTQQQMNAATDAVIASFKLPPEWKQLVAFKLQQLAAEIMQRDNAAEARMSAANAPRPVSMPQPTAGYVSPRASGGVPVADQVQ